MSGYERLCRRLLAVYPERYRAERAEEIVGTLLDADDRRPGARSRVREVTGLLRHATQVRLAGGGVVVHRAGAAWRLGLMLALAVVGAQAFLAAPVRGLLASLDGGLPLDQWLDPRWPVHLAWVLAGVALAVGRGRLAWWSTLAGGALAVGYAASRALGLDWPGDLALTWATALHVKDLLWCMASFLAVALAGGPAATAWALGDAPAGFAGRDVPSLVRRALALAAGAAVATTLVLAVLTALDGGAWRPVEMLRVSPLPALVALLVLVRAGRQEAEAGGPVGPARPLTDRARGRYAS